MGIIHPQNKLGFKSRTRVLASRKLWDGDDSGSAVCRCEFGPGAPCHADIKEVHPDRYGFREQIWTRIHYYLAALLRSGVPLTKATLGPGIRPELVLTGKLELSSEMERSLREMTAPSSTTIGSDEPAGSDAKVSALLASSVQDRASNGGDASLTGLDGPTPGMTDSNSGPAPSSDGTLGEPTRVTKFCLDSH